MHRFSGWWFGTVFFIYWQESSQSTFISFRGVGLPPTSFESIKSPCLFPMKSPCILWRTLGMGQDEISMLAANTKPVTDPRQSATKGGTSGAAEGAAMVRAWLR